MQTALLCGCGVTLTAHDGQQTACALRCVRCARRERLSRENFDGLRELVLQRDGYQCQCCGEVAEARLVVHHRRPGWNRLGWLVTICRACHVRVHLVVRPGYACSGLLLTLWREAHRGRPMQKRLAFEGGADPASQVRLFPDALSQ